jgi:hypothetical protein
VWLNLYRSDAEDKHGSSDETLHADGSTPGGVLQERNLP